MKTGNGTQRQRRETVKSNATGKQENHIKWTPCPYLTLKSYVILLYLI